MKEEIIKIDACDLSRQIEQVYGVKFNVPYWMEDQRLVEMGSIAKFSDEEANNNLKWKNYCAGRMAEFLKLGEQAPEPVDSWCASNVKVIMCDLCDKGKLEEGDYLLSFDD